MKLKPFLAQLLGLALLGSNIAQADVIPVTEDIMSGTEVTWTADNEYVLQSVIYVQTNATALASIRNNVWDVNAGANVEGEFIFTTVEFTNSLENAMLGGVSYTNDMVLDPRPQAGSPAYANVLPGAPMEVAYRGAFSGPQDNWADGWTALSQYGYLKPAQTPTGETFEDWATENNLPVGQDEPGDDPDGDDLPNAAEFALGSNPGGDNEDRAPAGVVVESDGQFYLGVTYTRSTTASGATVQVDAANDLGFGTLLELTVMSVVDLGDGTERVTVRTAAVSDGQTYFRTQVTLQ